MVLEPPPPSLGNLLQIDQLNIRRAGYFDLSHDAEIHMDVSYLSLVDPSLDPAPNAAVLFPFDPAAY